MAENIISDLERHKSKLLEFEPILERKLKDLKDKSTELRKMDQAIQSINEDERKSFVRIQVGEKVYRTRLANLLREKDSFFYKIISDDLRANNSISKSFFFDRDNKFFSYILDYMRTEILELMGIDRKSLRELKDELQFYGIHSALEIMDKILSEIEFISFTSSPRHNMAGTHSIEKIKDKNCMNGICVGPPYFIEIELNFPHEFERIEIGGWKGNSSAWYSENGSGAKIMTSLTKDGEYTYVGSIPSGFGTQIKEVKLIKSVAKFIKFTHTTYLGIGYLFIHPSLTI